MRKDEPTGTTQRRKERPTGDGHTEEHARAGMVHSSKPIASHWQDPEGQSHLPFHFHRTNDNLLAVKFAQPETRPDTLTYNRNHVPMQPYSGVS